MPRLVPVDMPLVPATDSVVVNRSPLPGGRIVSAQPYVKSGTQPRGGTCFVRIGVIAERGTANEFTRANLWQGYVRGDHVPASLPNLDVAEGDTLVADVVSLIPGVLTLGVRVMVDLDPKGKADGAWLHSEAPGSGPGTVRRINLTNPAAGADFADFEAPERALVRPLAFSGRLVADVNVAARRPFVSLTEGSANPARIVSFSEPCDATETILYFASINGTATTVTNTMDHRGMADVRFSRYAYNGPIVWRLEFDTLNLQAGDQWDRGVLVVEEWAMQ